MSEALKMLNHLDARAPGIIVGKDGSKVLVTHGANFLLSEIVEISRRVLSCPDGRRARHPDVAPVAN